MKRRCNVYIDGFNFYYGAIRGTPHKWLNLDRLFSLLRPSDELQTIHYFTAVVSGSHQPNQERYLRALATLPRVNVVLGKFKMKEIRCLVPSCHHPGSRVFRTTEEKRTDVNIALQMTDDVFHDRADLLVLVSGDSDLVPAVDLVKARNPDKKIVVYVPSRHPTRGAAVELRSAADKNKTFPLQLLPKCQFPAKVSDGRGGSIEKPKGW